MSWHLKGASGLSQPALGSMTQGIGYPLRNVDTISGSIYNPLMYPGDTIADQVDAAALDAFNNGGGIVLFPAGRFEITKSMAIYHGVEYLGSPLGPVYNTTPPSYCAGSSINFEVGGQGTVLVAEASVNATLEFFVANGSDRVNPVGGPEPLSAKFRNLAFSGGKTAIRCGAQNSYGFGYGALIEDVMFDKTTGDCLILYNFQGTMLNRVYGHKVERGILAVQHHSDCQNGNSVWIDVYFDIDGTTPPYGIKFQTIFDNGGASCTGDNCAGNAFNFMTLLRPQVNFFGASQGEACVILEGVNTPVNAPINAFNLIDLDVEGNVKYGLKMINTQNTSVSLKGYPNAPANADVQCIDVSDTTIDCVKATAVLDIDSASSIRLQGVVGSFLDRYPIQGTYYQPTANKNYVAGQTLKPAFEIDNATGTTGPAGVGTVGSEIWMPTRMMTRRSAFALTGSITLGIDRVGYNECRNASNATVTLPVIGTASNQAPVGVPVAFNKRDGAGNVTIQGGGSDTVGGAANYVLAATPGHSVFLMSSGPNNAGGAGDWMIVGKNP